MCQLKVLIWLRCSFIWRTPIKSLIPPIVQLIKVGIHNKLHKKGKLAEMFLLISRIQHQKSAKFHIGELFLQIKSYVQHFTAPVSLFLNQLLCQAFSSHIVLSDLSLLVEYMTLSYILCFTLPSSFFLFFLFLVWRKVAMTLKLNNFSSFAQIPIKVYIFGFLGVFGVQLIQIRWKILWCLTSRTKKPVAVEMVWKSSKYSCFWLFFD